MIKAITLVVSLALFSAVTANSAENTKTKTLMEILDTAFQMTTEDDVAAYESEVAEIIDDMDGCPYLDTLVHNFKSNFYSTCEEVVDEIETGGVPYILLSRSIEDSEDIDSERKTLLQNLVAQAYEIDPENETQKEDLISYLSSQLESCGNATDPASESFSCQALIETAEEEGLSYFEVRASVIQYAATQVSVETPHPAVVATPSKKKSKP